MVKVLTLLESRLIAVVERTAVSKCLLIFSTRPILGPGIEDGLSLGGIRLSGDMNCSSDRQGSLLLSLSKEAIMAEPTIVAQSLLMLPFPSWSCEGRQDGG